MHTHEYYMERCFQLALLGEGNVAPNPLVGAVLVCNGAIIGEGYHQYYGGPHAEVNCLASVKKEHIDLISRSTLYVSLEPCSHFGKTPPCTDLILEHSIKKVVVANTDPFEKVNGSGIQQLREGGVEVEVGVLADAGLQVNRRFFCFHNNKRPFVLLKWAQSADGFMGKLKQSTKISNDFTKVLVHKWRAQEAAILVGANTALVDDPKLTVRLAEGKNPTRVLLDRGLKTLDACGNIFNDQAPTIVYNELRQKTEKNIHFAQLKKGFGFADVLNDLYERNILSVLVEGGATVLSSIIGQNLWDEARVIINQQMILGEGITAPKLPKQSFKASKAILSDNILYFSNQ